MKSNEPLLSISEAKNKDLVPCINGVNLHSLHNPRREAEVFASNHLAHLSKSPFALILGLGFGYHIEEIAKIMRLRHKNFKIAVVEAVPELARLVNSYRGQIEDADIYASRDVSSLWENTKFGKFLLEKPVVIIHPSSFAISKTYYENFLARRAPQTIGSWKTPDIQFTEMFNQNSSLTSAQLIQSAPNSLQAAWVRAFWECKHADQ